MDMDDAKKMVMDGIQNAFYKSKQTFLCANCTHKKVCKKIDDEGDKCEDFLSDSTYKSYPSIYNMFQPIFDWLNFHYPHGELKFIVDSNSAYMYQEHGPSIFSKSLSLENVAWNGFSRLNEVKSEQVKENV